MPRNAVADSLLRFLNASPSPWHAVATAAERLIDAGFREVSERETPPREAAGGYFVRRGGSLAAFRWPSARKEKGALPWRVLAAHTDSPCLRLKPWPSESPAPYRQWGIEVYGGTLHNSWLDRDLGVAGRLHTAGNPGGEALLFRLEKGFRVPQIAIHLDRSVNEGLQLNPQRQLVPLLGLTGYPGQLEQALSDAAACAFADLTFDLCLFDSQPAAYGGLNDEFVYAGRLDDLGMAHACLEAFALAPAAEDALQVLALFDHEEVGSTSRTGADSSWLPAQLERLMDVSEIPRENVLAGLPDGLLVSADMAHALHPNYPEKHDGRHFPVLGGGPVLKIHSGQRYATDADSAARFLACARKAGVEPQRFVNRADLACGSTIGPMLGAHLGLPTVDVGNPMLSMHSAREMAGADDPEKMIAVLTEVLSGP